MVSSLDDFEEESWSVFNRLGEDLKKVTLVVVVDEDLVLLEDVDVLGYFDVHVGEVLSQDVVVCVGDAQELNASASEVFDSFDDCLGLKSDVLNSRSVVIVDVLLDLGLFLTDCWLIDWHFYVFVIVGNDD